MPQSNHAEEPAMSVTTLAIQPPVQLSAVTSMSRLACRRAPVSCASCARASSLEACMAWFQGNVRAVSTLDPAFVLPRQADAPARDLSCFRGRKEERPACAGRRVLRGPPGSEVVDPERHAVGPRRAEEGVPRAGLDRRIDAHLLVG